MGKSSQPLGSERRVAFRASFERDFLRLINRTRRAFHSIRKQREIILWNAQAVSEPGKDLTLTAYDAMVWLTACGIVSQGPKWEGVKLALPGLQYAVRDGVDRPGTFAAITLLSARELLVGAGSLEELTQDRVIGLPAHTWLMPISASCRFAAQARG